MLSQKSELHYVLRTAERLLRQLHLTGAITPEYYKKQLFANPLFMERMKFCMLFFDILHEHFDVICDDDEYATTFNSNNWSTGWLGGSTRQTLKISPSQVAISLVTGWELCLNSQSANGRYFKVALWILSNEGAEACCAFLISLIEQGSLNHGGVVDQTLEMLLEVIRKTPSDEAAFTTIFGNENCDNGIALGRLSPIQPFSEFPDQRDARFFAHLFVETVCDRIEDIRCRETLDDWLLGQYTMHALVWPAMKLITNGYCGDSIMMKPILSYLEENDCDSQAETGTMRLLAEQSTSLDKNWEPKHSLASKIKSKAGMDWRSRLEERSGIPKALFDVACANTFEPGEIPDHWLRPAPDLAAVLGEVLHEDRSWMFSNRTGKVSNENSSNIYDLIDSERNVELETYAAELDKSLVSTPYCRPLLMERARCDLEQGKPAQAAEILMTCICLSPQEPRGWALLATACKAAGQESDARILTAFTKTLFECE